MNDKITQVYKDQMERANLSEEQYLDLLKHVNPLLFMYYINLLSCNSTDPMLNFLKTRVHNWLRNPLRKYKTPLSPKQESYILQTKF